MRRSAALAVTIMSAACFATLAVLTRLAYAEGGRALPVLATRFAIAAALLAIYAAIRQPRALQLGVHDLPRYLALSVTGYGAASICFFGALHYASASVVTVLLYAYPAIVAVVGAALDRERIGGWRVLAIALTFAGCALAAGLIDPGAVVSLPGIVLGLGAALAYAAFTLLSERLVPGRSRLVLMTYTFGLSALGVGALVPLVGETFEFAAWTPGLWTIVLVIVAVPTLAAVLLYLRGIRELGAAQAALVSTLEPVFTIAMAATILGERLTMGQALGAALVVAGIVMSERRRPAAAVPAAI